LGCGDAAEGVVELRLGLEIAHVGPATQESLPHPGVARIKPISIRKEFLIMKKHAAAVALDIVTPAICRGADCPNAA
jgi:hypothetical protein